MHPLECALRSCAISVANAAPSFSFRTNLNQTTANEPSISTQLGQALDDLKGKDHASSQLDALIENGPGACYVVDAESLTVRYLSNKAFEFLPQSFRNLMEDRRKWPQLVCDEDRPHYKAVIEKLAERGGEAMIVYRLDASKKGAWLPVKDFVTPISDSEGQTVGFLGRIIDDSFRIQAMDTLVKRSWKEVATAVTRRFLHDFNNMIAGIYSLSELYAVPGSDAKTMTEAMVHIRDSSIRAQKTTQKIRELASMTDGEASYYEVANLIREQEDYLRAILPRHVELEFVLSEDSLPARLDANRFKQAMLHLASNAADAAVTKPRISIRCEAVESESPSGASRFARIELRDNGDGIKERHLKQAFDPFFTTKDSKIHVGMGLFIVKRFAEEFGGSISIESPPDEGTIVTMLLPLANLNETIAPPVPAYPQDAAPSAKPKKTPTLLIYSWEDIARHPLVNAIRADDWKFRIHIDPHQLKLDLKDLSEELDGVLVFRSALDEQVDSLIESLAQGSPAPNVAVIVLGDNLDSIGQSLQSQCGLLAPGSAKPSSLLKKLAKHFA